MVIIVGLTVVVCDMMVGGNYSRFDCLYDMMVGGNYSRFDCLYDMMVGGN